MDGTIGRLTWATVKKPQLEDRTRHFKMTEIVPNLSALSKLQYAEIGFNPTRDEFELVCVCFIVIFISKYYHFYSSIGK